MELVFKQQLPSWKNGEEFARHMRAKTVILLAAYYVYEFQWAMQSGDVSDYFKVALDDLMVVCDDVALPIGRCVCGPKGAAAATTD